MSYLSIPRARLKTRDFAAGVHTLAADNERLYFFVRSVGGATTVKFGAEGGLPLADGEHFSPHVAPTNEIELVVTGGVAHVITNKF